MMVCQVCKGWADPGRVCELPVVVGKEIVLKKAILCGRCENTLEEEVQKWLPVKKAEIVTGFLKVWGIRPEELEDHEEWMK